MSPRRSDRIDRKRKAESKETEEKESARATALKMVKAKHTKSSPATTTTASTTAKTPAKAKATTASKEAAKAKGTAKTAKTAKAHTKETTAKKSVTMPVSVRGTKTGFNLEQVKAMKGSKEDWFKTHRFGINLDKKFKKKEAECLKALEEGKHVNKLMGDEPHVNFFNHSATFVNIRQWLDNEHGKAKLDDDDMAPIEELKMNRVFNASEWRKVAFPVLQARYPGLVDKATKDNKKKSDKKAAERAVKEGARMADHKAVVSSDKQVDKDKATEAKKDDGKTKDDGENKGDGETKDDGEKKDDGKNKGDGETKDDGEKKDDGEDGKTKDDGETKDNGEKKDDGEKKMPAVSTGKKDIKPNDVCPDCLGVNSCSCSTDDESAIM